MQTNYTEHIYRNMKHSGGHQINLQEIQRKFCARFPCLRIEFDRYCTQMGVVEYTEMTTVKELQLKFRAIGVQAVVFRRFGRVWLQVEITSGWTLQRQNEEGKLFS